MLVDKLRLAIAAKQQREIVKPGNDALQFDAFDQKHGYGRLATAQGVQKDILEILIFIGHIGLLFLAATPQGDSGLPGVFDLLDARNMLQSAPQV
jgi:hypothetical protein